MAESAPMAVASIAIQRPQNVVVDAFFDVDHAIRNKIHHGVSLRWVNDEGARRVRQEVQVLSRAQIDDFVIEKGDAGQWIKRFVAGPNVETRLVGHFSSDQDNATRVRLEAFVPAGGFAFGFGKLSQLGMENLLKKLLGEHRRALEGYQPARARGAIQAALDVCRDLTAVLAGLPQDQRRAVGSNLLEAAHLVAVSDGQVDVAEREALQAIARVLCFVELDDAGCERMIASITEAVKNQSMEQRCEKVGARLKVLGVGALGVAAGALVAQVSHGIDPQEHAVLEAIASAAGLEDWAAVVRKIDRALATTASAREP